MTTTNTTLTIGQTYDFATLDLIGWTEGDGSGHEGYELDHYFDPAGRYLGPDQHGIEPLVERPLATQLLADGFVRVWDVYTQTWVETCQPSDQVLASLPAGERDAVIAHCDLA